MTKKLEELSAARHAAYQHTKDVAIQALQLGTPYAFEIIYRAYQEYLKADKAQDRYICTYAKKNCNPMQALATCKNLKDIYWELPVSVKALWDANWELAGILKKYR
jgi:hypothetical protein